jgi:hypothetical protein
VIEVERPFGFLDPDADIRHPRAQLLSARWYRRFP